MPNEQRDRAEDVQALGRLPIFGALKDGTIRFLRDRCERVEVRKGDDFFVQGEMGDAIFLLRKGRVAIVRTLDGESVVLAEFGPGDCLGEMALVGISPRNATARALDDCVALKLVNLRLLELYEHDLEQFTLIQMNLGREVARRLAEADRMLFDYAKRLGETCEDADVCARIAETLK